VVLSEQPSAEPKENLQNVYIARRQGNGVKDGAIVVINNDDYEAKSLTVNVNADGFTNWAKQTLVNLIDTAETITVDANGQVELSAPARNYSIWVKQQDLK
jgi:alpha-amylase